MNNQITPITDNDNRRVKDFVVSPASAQPPKCRAEYIYSCTNAMFDYLKHKNVDILMKHLIKIEVDAFDKEEEGQTDKEMYFKFGQDDPLTTTINNIYMTLKYGNQKDKDFLIEQFEKSIQLDTDNELQVFFN